MRFALRLCGLLIVARPSANNGRYNHDTGKDARKICMLCVATCSCLSLHARLHTTVAISASPEARQLSKGAMRWHVGDGQMPHLIYPQATRTRPAAAPLGHRQPAGP